MSNCSKKEQTNCVDGGVNQLHHTDLQHQILFIVQHILLKNVWYVNVWATAD